MGFMDHLLATLSPERAVKTAAARMAIQTLNSGYGNYGANLHKKSMRGWMWHGGDSKRDIEDNLRVLRERSRDAYMGVPLATGAIKTMRTNVICGGLTPTPQIDNEFLGISDEEAQKVNAQIMREFSLWADKPTCDADRIDNFYMLQQLAFTGFLMNGDALAVLQNKRTPNVPYDLRVRIVEADRLCSPAFTDIDSPREIDGRLVQRITQGVETDADGMVVAYFHTGAGDIFKADEVLTEYRKGDRKLAAFVAPDVHDIPIARRGYEVHSYQPAYIAPSRVLTMDELKKRGFGEALYPGMDEAQRAARLLADDMNDMENRIAGTEEWMAAQTMISNGCTMQEMIDGKTKGDKKIVRFYTTNSLSRIRMRAGKIRAATKRHNACNTGCGRSAGNQTRSGTT